MDTRLVITLLLGTLALRPVLAEEKTNIEDLYSENCAACHGEELAGGMSGSLIDDEWKLGGGDEQIATAIRDGNEDLGMPAWAGTLDEKQIRAMVIYIREKGAERRSESSKHQFEEHDGVYQGGGQHFTIEELGRGEGILWSLEFLPDGRMLATQRDGVLWLFSEGDRQAVSGTPEVWQRGQGGLLDVQVHPGYADNGWVYLSYSEHAGVMEGDKKAGMTTVVRGRIRDGAWVDEERIFRVDNSLYSSRGHHFGSRFVFKDGYLFFSVGDRGSMNLAQELDRPNGKVFRIHDDGRVPQDNPFIEVDGALPEIWSYGHRNPQGMDLDPASGGIWLSEHGPRGGDEINLVVKGLNYGWPVITYGMNYNGTPMTDKTHQEGMEQPRHYWVPSIAVAGIDFCECAPFPAWNGKLLAGGMASEELHLLSIEDGKVTADQILLKGRGRIRDVSSGPDGFVYLLLNERDPVAGRIVRLKPKERAAP